MLLAGDQAVERAEVAALIVLALPLQLVQESVEGPRHVATARLGHDEELVEGAQQATIMGDDQQALTPLRDPGHQPGHVVAIQVSRRLVEQQQVRTGGASHLQALPLSFAGTCGLDVAPEVLGHQQMTSAAHHPAAGWFLPTCQHVEQRRLAHAIATDDRDAFVSQVEIRDRERGRALPASRP